MAKKVIRLTEGDLHRIIKESVNNLLTELHPFTYANYANGRYAQGQTDKAEKGRDAAVKAFNDRYGYEVKDDEGKPFSSVKMQKNYDNKGYNVQSTHPINKDVYYDTSDRYPNRMSKMANASDNMRRNYRIANQMHSGHGNFEYEKGKGYRYKGFDDEDYKNDDSLYLK